MISIFVMTSYESKCASWSTDNTPTGDGVLVVIGIGIPGCGKTTHLKPLADKQGLTYVNRDDIRQELTGDPTNHTREKLVTKILFERVAESLQKGQGAVIDATHSRVKDRRIMIDYCRLHGADRVIGMWFDIPIETCRQRNAARDRMVREEALFTMRHRLKINPPSIEEGFDEVKRIER